MNQIEMTLRMTDFCAAVAASVGPVSVSTDERRTPQTMGAVSPAEPRVVAQRMLQAKARVLGIEGRVTDVSVAAVTDDAVRLFGRVA